MILASVLREGLVLAAAGIATGLGGTALLSRVVATLLYGVTTLDPVAFTTAPVLLIAVSMIASLLPAGRAAALDPMNVLRQA